MNVKFKKGKTKFLFKLLRIITNQITPVFSLQILIGGDFRIIDRDQIQLRVRRPLVGSVQSPGRGWRWKHPSQFLNWWILTCFWGGFLALKLLLFASIYINFEKKKNVINLFFRQVYRIFRIFLTIEQFFVENDFSRLTTISHFSLLFLRKMSHGSAFFQINDKCTSLVEINLIIQK